MPLQLPSLTLPASIVVPGYYHNALLGLGDIFVPGLLIAHSLRVDLAAKRAFSCTTSFFRNTVIGYIAGLLLASSASMWSNAPQPALLYILPCVSLFPVVEIRTLSSNVFRFWLSGDPMSVLSLEKEGPRECEV